MKDLMLLIRVQARIATFLAELAADHLVALAEGRAHLTIVTAADVPEPVPASAATAAPAPAAASEPVPVPRAAASRPRRALAATSSFDAETVAAQLRACATVDQGAELLANLKPRATDLKELARFLGVPPGRNMADTAKRVLTITLASRGKHAALTRG
ncbi:hypothetical protein AB0G04_28430 [Actinoplanes sp. NPDC023801]|uniref:hypothetical protein n=1 Tax=Actinoplanes sp. NPDC023801 TaxID=3154595 RepID=UPI0033FD092C